MCSSSIIQLLGISARKLIRNIDTVCARDVGILGYIVHHKTYIDSHNIFNPEVTLNFDNLELLCLDCHNEEHFKQSDFTLDGELKPSNENILELAGIFKKEK